MSRTRLSTWRFEITTEKQYVDVPPPNCDYAVLQIDESERKIELRGTFHGIGSAHVVVPKVVYYSNDMLIAELGVSRVATEGLVLGSGPTFNYKLEADFNGGFPRQVSLKHLLTDDRERFKLEEVFDDELYKELN